MESPAPSGMLATTDEWAPEVMKRTERWDEGVEKSNFFVDTLLSIEGSNVLSEYPRKHALSKVDTTGSFDKVAKEHKRRGFYF